MQLLDIKKKYVKKLQENNCQSRTLYPRISILKKQNKTKRTVTTIKNLAYAPSKCINLY